MYAVIETGGKQYRVKPGDIFQVEKLEGEVGAAIKFSNVLFCSKPDTEKSEIWLGKPYLQGATVETEVVGQGRGDKIIITKMKRRKQYRRNQGHRQYYTQLLVTALDNGAGQKATLSADDKKAKLSKFQSHLKAKGPARTLAKAFVRSSQPAAQKKTAAASTAETAAPRKAPAKKAAAPKAAKKES